MDNLAHSLMGICVAKSLKFKTPQKEKEAILVGILASNLPDLDILYTSITGVEQLGYLLHHRGHTHTLALAPLLALLAWFLGSIFTGGKGKWNLHTFLVAFISTLLHLVFDFFNSYGVHPFWPLNNDWIYGDSLFIVEPTIWFSLLAYVLWSSRNKKLQVFWGLISFVALAMMWIFAPVSLSIKIFLTLLFVGMQAYQAYEKGSLRLAWSSLGTIVLIFASCSIWAEVRMREHLQKDFSQERVVQLARSPQPGNPFCWSNIVVTEVNPQLYVARIGSQSLLPGWLSCGPLLRKSSISKVENLEPPLEASISSGEILWEQEYVDSVAALRSFYANNCRARAALRFYRAPYWEEAEGNLVMGDLRFPKRGTRSFSEVVISEEPCPQYVSNWTPPLQEIFGLPEWEAEDHQPSK